MIALSVAEAFSSGREGGLTALPAASSVSRDSVSADFRRRTQALPFPYYWGRVAEGRDGAESLASLAGDYRTSAETGYVCLFNRHLPDPRGTP